MSGDRQGDGVSQRPLRADARRNRDAILAAAREAFETEGVYASLDGIALRAGVGNATLYRNFPTRDDLQAAVMEVNIAIALTDADEVARVYSPRAALAEWIVRLAWRLRIWHDLPQCLASASGDPGSSVNVACAHLSERTHRLVEAAKSAGDVAAATTADAVFELIMALSWAIDRFHDDESAARGRVEFAISGLFAGS